MCRCFRPLSSTALEGWLNRFDTGWVDSRLSATYELTDAREPLWRWRSTSTRELVSACSTCMSPCSPQPATLVTDALCAQQQIWSFLRLTYSVSCVLYIFRFMLAQAVERESFLTNNLLPPLLKHNAKSLSRLKIIWKNQTLLYHLSSCLDVFTLYFLVFNWNRL